MNPGLIAFTVLASICTASFLVLMGYAISEVSHCSKKSGECKLNNDCGYFEICNQNHCAPGCTGIQCQANAICADQFHGWRCECMTGYVPTQNGSCRYNLIQPNF